VRSWVARWVCGGSFEKSKTQFSLEPLSQPAALLSGEAVLCVVVYFSLTKEDDGLTKAQRKELKAAKKAAAKGGK
jgi:hypothetical protein